jgi:hypothetical protein
MTNYLQSKTGNGLRLELDCLSDWGSAPLLIAAATTSPVNAEMLIRDYQLFRNDVQTAVAELIVYRSYRYRSYRSIFRKATTAEIDGCLKMFA